MALKGLSLLVRLARQECDECQIALARAINLREQAMTQLTLIRDAIHQEEELAAQTAMQGDTSMLIDLPSWRSAATAQEQRCLASLHNATNAEEAARESLRKALAEAQRLETALRNRKEAEEKAADQTQQNRAEDQDNVRRAFDDT